MWRTASVVVPLLVLTVAACGSPAEETAPAVPDTTTLPATESVTVGVPDDVISLRLASVFETVRPSLHVVPQTDPGRNELVARANDEAPPVIPHGIVEMLPITQEDNLCIDCHGDRSDARVGPLMSPSHFTDLRNAPTVERDEVVPSRWMCLSCHVEVSDAPPLVANPGRPAND